MQGDMTGATTYGSKARRLNIIAVALIVISVIICIVVITVTSVSSAATIKSTYDQSQSFNRYHYSY